MNRYRSGCSRLVLALLLVGLWPQAARGWVDQIVFEESRRAMMLATGLIVTGTGLAVTTRGLGPPETAFDGRLKQLPSMRVGPLVELRLRDGSGLAGIVLAWIEQDDSLYIRSLSDLATWRSSSPQSIRVFRNFLEQTTRLSCKNSEKPASIWARIPSKAQARQAAGA